MLQFRENQGLDLDKGLGLKSSIAAKTDDQLQQLAIHVDGKKLNVKVISGLQNSTYLVVGDLTKIEQGVCRQEILYLLLLFKKKFP